MIVLYGKEQAMSKKDDEIRWDGPPACRWRKYYAGKTHRISASDLLKEAGIVADRTDPKNTKHLAKAWFQRLKEEIDAKIALKKFMPNQEDYLLHRESMQRDLIGLIAVGNSDNKPLIDRIKGNIAKIDQMLSRAEVTERILSPLPLSLHNPLALSEKVAEADAEEMTIEHVISELQDEYDRIVALGNEKRFGYYDYDVFLNDEEWFQDEFMVCFEDRLKGNDLFDPEKRKQFIIETIEAKNMEIIREKAEKIFRQRRLDVENSKKEFDLIDDFRRGQIVAEIGSKNIPNKEEFRLHYQIERYINWEYQRHLAGEIQHVSFDKIARSVEVFKKWTKDRHIRELESKEIPLEYHAHLQKLVQIHRKTRGAEGVKGVSARDLLYHFKRFVFWLQEHELIGNVSKVYFSRIALRISTDATFGKPIPLDDVRKIYVAASDRMKLYMLLMMNCGYGAAEIGALERNQVDFNSGRITRRRGKTRRHKNTPLVSYKLWKPTLDLLVQEYDNSQQLLRKNWGLREQKWDYQDIKELVLLNGNCSPVCHNQVNPETMKNQRTDGVRDDWNDLLAKLGMTKETARKKKESKNKKDVTPIYTFYQLRDTAASLLGNSMTISDDDPKFDKKNYSMDTFLFLGHAPKTTAEKNYVRIGENRIDDALEWLERQFFPDSKKNDENPA